MNGEPVLSDARRRTLRHGSREARLCACESPARCAAEVTERVAWTGEASSSSLIFRQKVSTTIGLVQ